MLFGTFRGLTDLPAIMSLTESGRDGLAMTRDGFSPSSTACANTVLITYSASYEETAEMDATLMSPPLCVE